MRAVALALLTAGMYLLAGCSGQQQEQKQEEQKQEQVQQPQEQAPEQQPAGEQAADTANKAQ
jgi:PBP1b-binding outer membrane lipoprotein LpoB